MTNKIYKQQNIQLVRLDQGNSHIDEFGRLHAKGILGRVGTQVYLKDGKPFVEVRLETEVRASIIDSTVVSFNHSAPIIDIDNAMQHVVGYVTNMSFDSGFIYGDITITDGEAILAAQSTHQQLSLGYLAMVEESEGVWVDELGVQGPVGESYTYQGIQRAITINHLALVKAGRAGNAELLLDGADIRLDNTDSLLSVKENLETKQSKTIMANIIHNDQLLTFEGNDADKVVLAFSSLKEDLTKNDAALAAKDAENLALKEELEALKSINETLQAKADSLEVAAKEPKLDADVISTEVFERLSVWKAANKLDSIDPALSASEAKKACLIAAKPELQSKLDGKSDNYIDAFWEASAVFAPNQSDKNAEQFEQKADGRGFTKDNMMGSPDMEQIAQDALKSRRSRRITRK